MKIETQHLPYPIIHSLLTDPAFSLVLEHCLDEPELIEGFTKIYGVALPRKPTSPIIAMVDEATGWRDEQYNKFFIEFIPFVHRCVYLPLQGKLEVEEKAL
ncbi:hypothetical protein SAMN05216516_112103 [Izhakiella capsodis]|uniref:Uncharacterized protein n=1 Tax=Izhakiella capsodis TaxID=1367852 RepID=A0A1I5APH3_9GAMM|nr:hypothetical protein [Izhakiella capsodis]SFN64262.1 hypothetical protein SAMN05216516_112103 [Izhakiella capsodis]